MEISVAGKPLTPQEAVDEQRRRTEELRSDLSRLAAIVTDLHEATLAPHWRDGAAHTRQRAREAMGQAFTKRVLWVDDRPANNAYEIAALQDREMKVVEALTTAEGLQRLVDAGPFDAIITDMERTEEGDRRETAGLDLLEALRERAQLTPAFVYCGPGSLARYADQIYAAGALGATTDPTELLELLGVNRGPQFQARLEREVQRLLVVLGSTTASGAAGEPDFTLERDGRRVGVLVKSWDPLRTSASQAVESCLRGFSPGPDLGEVWIVSPEPLDDVALPPEVGGVPLRRISIGELRELAGARASTTQGAS